MAEFATLARPYAEALFQVVEKGDLPQAGVALDALAAIAANPQLRQFADAPRVTSQQVFDVVCGVVGVPLNNAAKNLLRTVIDNGRLAAVPEIAAQFRALAAQRSGVSHAIVYSAFPIEPAALADLLTALETRFKRKLNATVQLQPELIGGIRVVVGDEVLDASVAARLAKMKAALTA